jgi:hypothetical protein
VAEFIGYLIVFSVIMLVMAVVKQVRYKPSEEADRLLQSTESPRISVNNGTRWLTPTRTALVMKPRGIELGADVIVYKEDVRFVGVDRSPKRYEFGEHYYIWKRHHLFFYGLSGSELLEISVRRRDDVEERLGQLGWRLADLPPSKGSKPRPTQLPLPPDMAPDRPGGSDSP